MSKNTVLPLVGDPAATILSAYGAACKKACATVHGAYALADKLGQLGDAARLRGERRRLCKDQAEAASLAAAGLRVRAELNERIPQALERNQQAASSERDAADATLKSARKRAGAIEAKLSDARQRLEAVEGDLRNAVRAAQDQLTTVRERLGVAQAAQDFDAMERVTDEVCEAERNLKAAEDGNLALRLKIEAIGGVAKDLEAQLQAEQDVGAEAIAAKQAAESRLAFVESDRQMVTTLQAMLAAVAAGDEKALLRLDDVEGCALFFMAEHRPHWREGEGRAVLSIGELRRMGKHLKGPDWSVFETDPSTLDDSPPVSVPTLEMLAVNVANDKIAVRNDELAGAFHRPEMPGVTIAINSVEG